MAVPEAFNPRNLIYTLWLFTASDIKTFVLGEALFGTFGALAGPYLTTNHTPSVLAILSRLPHTLLWSWLNTLIFNINNQSLPSSVLEDKLNKSWRPVPAGRISQEQARFLLFATIPISIAIIYLCLGATEESILLLVFYWMYNDLGGGDKNWVVRNLILMFGYNLYGHGALRVACNHPVWSTNSEALSWVILTGVVVFTIIPLQDFRDIKGDRARNRKTAPIAIGEMRARYMVASALLFWSVTCSAYWAVNFWLYAGFIGLGSWIAFRTVCLRDEAADRASWKYGNIWITAVFALPWLKYVTT